jgi:hypothetical protein
MLGTSDRKMEGTVLILTTGTDHNTIHDDDNDDTHTCRGHIIYAKQTQFTYYTLMNESSVTFRTKRGDT